MRTIINNNEQTTARPINILSLDVTTSEAFLLFLFKSSAITFNINAEAKQT